jgi:uncharacterized membrane protein YfcA
VDPLADWQLRILSEYSKTGSSIMEQSILFWAPWSSAVLGALIGFILVGQTSTGWAELMVLFLISLGMVVVLKARLRVRKHMKRTKIIEKALEELSGGTPIEPADFSNYLKRICSFEDGA